MKLNTSDGVAIWKKHYGGASNEVGYSIAVSGNYIYITGYEQSDTAGGADAFVMKLNTSDGTSVWTKHYGGASFDYGHSIAVSGNYIYITGSEQSDTAGFQDIFIMKLNESDGTSVWTKHYGGAFGDFGDSILVSGNYIYITGLEQSDIAEGTDAFVIKLDANSTTSNMGADWTADGDVMGAGWTADGVPIKTSTTAANSPWSTVGLETTGGTGIAMGASWTVNGLAIRTPTTAADSPWTTAAAQTTGGTGIDMGALWTADGLLIRKTTDGSNYWTSGLQKDGVPIP